MRIDNLYIAFFPSLLSLSVVQLGFCNEDISPDSSIEDLLRSRYDLNPYASFMYHLKNINVTSRMMENGMESQYDSKLDIVSKQRVRRQNDVTGCFDDTDHYYDDDVDDDDDDVEEEKISRNIRALDQNGCEKSNTEEQKVRKYSEVADEDLKTLHVHVRTKGHPDIQNCGGCKILWELYHAIKRLGVSVSNNEFDKNNWDFDKCPDEKILAEPIKNQQTIAIVYPEGETIACEGPGDRIHVRWILAPLGLNTPIETSDSYGKDDMVFHYSRTTSSLANFPDHNVLQLIVSPEVGDEYDLPHDVVMNQNDRDGILWMLRKATMFPKLVKYIHEGHGEVTKQLEEPTVDDFLKTKYFVSYVSYTVKCNLAGNSYMSFDFLTLSTFLLFFA